MIIKKITALCRQTEFEVLVFAFYFSTKNVCRKYTGNYIANTSAPDCSGDEKDHIPGPRTFWGHHRGQISKKKGLLHEDIGSALSFVPGSHECLIRRWNTYTEYAFGR